MNFNLLIIICSVVFSFPSIMSAAHLHQNAVVLANNASISIKNMVSGLLQFDDRNLTSEQNSVLDRISKYGPLEPCLVSNDNSMLCLVDTLIKDTSVNLISENITSISDKVDTGKFSEVLRRILYSSKDEELYKGYAAYISRYSNSDDATYYFWSGDGPEYRLFMSLTDEFQSLLVHHDQVPLPQMIASFIIQDPATKQNAIQKLIDNPLFELKPLSQESIFYSLNSSIQSRLHQLEETNKNETAFYLPLDDILQTNFVDWRTQHTNETQVDNKDFPKEELLIMNSVLRGLIGDLLGVILDLPGKLLGSGKNGGGLTITIGIGGNGGRGDDDEDYEDKVEDINKRRKQSSSRKRPPTF